MVPASAPATAPGGLRRVTAGDLCAVADRVKTATQAYYRALDNLEACVRLEHNLSRTEREAAVAAAFCELEDVLDETGRALGLVVA